MYTPRTWTLLLAALAALALPVRSTTVIPMTVEQAAVEADRIFVATVTNKTCFEEPSGGRIWTRVTFRVDDPVEGAKAGEFRQLDFLGGEVGGKGMLVVGSPQFFVGQRVVLMALDKPGMMSPVSGFNQGVFKIALDASGVERILDLEDKPVTQVTNGSHRLMGPDDGLSLRDFTAALRDIRKRAKRT